MLSEINYISLFIEFHKNNSIILYVIDITVAGLLFPGSLLLPVLNIGLHWLPSKPFKFLYLDKN